MATDDIKSAEDKKNAELEKEEYYPHSADDENTDATADKNNGTNADAGMNANTNAGTNAGDITDNTVGACGCMSIDDSMDTDRSAGMDDDMDDDEGIDAILVEEDIIIAGVVDDDDMDEDNEDGLNDDLTGTADTDPNADYRVDASLEDAVRDNLSGDDFVDSGKDFSGDAGEELSFSDDSDKKDKKKDDKKEDTPDYISGDGDKIEELDDKIVSETNKLIAEKRAAHEAAHHKGCGCSKTV